MSNINQALRILDGAFNLASFKNIYTIEEKVIIYSNLLEINKYVELAELEKQKVELQEEKSTNDTVKVKEPKK